MEHDRTSSSPTKASAAPRAGPPGYTWIANCRERPRTFRTVYDVGKAAIRLGVNYVSLFDELAIFNRPSATNRSRVGKSSSVEAENVRAIFVRSERCRNASRARAQHGENFGGTWGKFRAWRAESTIKCSTPPHRSGFRRDHEFVVEIAPREDRAWRSTNDIFRCDQELRLSVYKADPNEFTIRRLLIQPGGRRGCRESGGCGFPRPTQLMQENRENTMPLPAHVPASGLLEAPPCGIEPYGKLNAPKRHTAE